jgi:putative transposase
LAQAVGPGKVPDMSTLPDPYRGYRHPPEIIRHAVWLYHCFSLSLREVKLILAERGVEVSDESIGQ